MAKGLGTLTVWLNADTRKFSRGLTDGKRMMQQFNVAAYAMGAAAAGAVVAMGVKSVKAFASAEESINKFRTVFRDVGLSADHVANKLADSFGLAGSTAKTMLGDTGDLLTGFGYSASEALRMAEATNRLALDLASFTNYAGGASGATQALVKAFTGEREAVKALGIVIREEMVMDKLRLAGKDKLTGFALVQAKAEATLAIAIEQSKNAIGDYERTSNSLVNTQRRLGESYKSIQESLGEILVTSLGVQSGLGSIGDRFKQFADYLAQNIQGIAFQIEFMWYEFEHVFKQMWDLGRNVGTGIYTVFKAAGGNIVAVGQWVSDNFQKLVDNFFAIFTAHLRDMANLVEGVAKNIWAAMTGQDTDWTGVFANIGKEVEKAMGQSGISQLVLDESALDFAGAYGKVVDDIEKNHQDKLRKQEDAFNRRMAIAGMPGLEDKPKGDDPAKDAKKAVAKAESPITEAIHRGSMEAMRAETKRTRTEDKIEQNTRETANGINRVADEIGKLGRFGAGMDLEVAV
jgi:hypothetical protein